MKFWSRLRDHLQSGHAAYVCLVADNTDHSPGTRGARIFVRPDASTEGTMGGGVMEGDLIRTALGVLGDAGRRADFRPTWQALYHRKKGPGAKSGLACAGAQTNLHLVCEPGRDLAVVTEVARRVEADLPGVLQVDEHGMRMADGAPPARDRPAVRLASEASGETRSWRYEEQLLNWKRAAIFGGGHCGLALSRVLRNLGYTVTLIDTRPDVFTFTGNHHARHKIAVDDFSQAAARIAHPELTHAIVMTRQQPDDVRALIGILDYPFPYIGVMGSPAKLAQIRKDLLAAGVAPERFEQVRSPIGLQMTSNTPEEIAISVAAELLQERRALFPHH